MGSAYREACLSHAGNRALGVNEMIGNIISMWKGDTTQSIR